ncbi:uncharacterized protein LOC110737233 [Chenopodium quinoa]|uniref:uncharacterized protein LOC110737233 n=1 Tax=Chenopodium quinoa TaxID=63459 RepID=UPI000B77398C|nr:uncharacterized protein LOC110737233 [Chenopodium quinoa]
MAGWGLADTFSHLLNLGRYFKISLSTHTKFFVLSNKQRKYRRTFSVDCVVESTSFIEAASEWREVKLRTYLKSANSTRVADLALGQELGDWIWNLNENQEHPCLRRVCQMNVILILAN